AMLGGEAAAADAVGEACAQLLQLGDPAVKSGGPPGRHLGPVFLTRCPALRQAGQRGADLGQRDANLLADADDGDAAQHVTIIAPLVAGGAVAADEALAFVEVQRRDGNATAGCELSYSQFARCSHRGSP